MTVRTVPGLGARRQAQCASRAAAALHGRRSTATIGSSCPPVHRRRLCRRSRAAQREREMTRSVRKAASLVAVGAAAAIALFAWRVAREPAREGPAAATADLASSRPFGSVPGLASGGRERSDLEQRLARLENRLAQEAAERQQLQERFDAVAAELAGRGGAELPADGSPPASAAPGSPATVASDAAPVNAIDYSKSAMERALAA